jgi:hypothetical protein
MKNTIQFSSQQKECIRKGALKRQGLIRETTKSAQRAGGKAVRNEYLDTILTGTTGIGKTRNVEKAIDEIGVPYITLKGNKSMFAFGGDLMLLHSRMPKGSKMALIIDDCDSFFENKENINMLKGMTGKVGTRQFQYNKKINEHAFTEAQMQVMEQYQTEGMHGFTVPTDDFIFIFTTNFNLPFESDAKEAMEKGVSAKANRLQDLAAVRGRFNVKDYMLDKETNWGWIAEVALNDGGLDMLESDAEKMFLLDWMYNNWDDMTETNIRTIEKMAYEMVDYPDEYRDNWEADFLK